MMNNVRPTVFVLKEQVISGAQGIVPMDYTPAYEYGDVEFITSFDPPLHPRSTALSLWEEHVDKFFDRYRVGIDLIVPTGSPFAILKFGKTLGQRYAECSHTQHKILVWDRKQNRYIQSPL